MGMKKNLRLFSDVLTSRWAFLHVGLRCSLRSRLSGSPAAFCEAAPRVEYDLHMPVRNLQLSACCSSCCSAFCPRSGCEAGSPRRISVFEGTAAPTSCRLSTAAISCNAVAASYSVISNFTRSLHDQFTFNSPWPISAGACEDSPSYTVICLSTSRRESRQDGAPVRLLRSACHAEQQSGVPTL